MNLGAVVARPALAVLLAAGLPRWQKLTLCCGLVTRSSQAWSLQKNTQHFMCSRVQESRDARDLLGL